jgi:hypothetical protein
MGQGNKETIQFFPERPSQVPTPCDPCNPSLDTALQDSFPASDPPSTLQPRSEDEVAAADDAAGRRDEAGARSDRTRNAG